MIALNEEEKSLLDDLYLRYQSNQNVFLKDLASFVGRDRTTVGNYYRKKFGQDYLDLTKRKRKIKREMSEEARRKISNKLKGIKKPERTLEHRKKLSLAFKGKSYIERFGEHRAQVIIEKIRQANIGNKREFKNKELWRKNLSSSLKGRKTWNKGKKGLQMAWNKANLPENNIVELYKKGMLTKEIAKRYNLSKYPILRILRENNVKIRNYSDISSDKSLEELYGKKKADEIRKTISNSNRGRKVTWGHKISKSLRRYYEKCREDNYMVYRTRKAFSPEQRAKLSIVHKKYLKEHPEELARLRRIQYPGNVTKVEQKMLNFLKERFKEGEDFLFDKQDSTGKTFYRPDFQFPKKMVILEIDGYYKHFTKEGYKRDKVREYYLKKNGWKIHRFNFYDIGREYRFNDVKEKIGVILGF